MRRFLTALGYLVLAAAALAAGAAVWGYAAFTRPGPSTAATVTVIPRGGGLEEIARALEAAGVVERAAVFAAGARLSGRGGELKAGEYRFPARISPRGAMELLVSGKTVARRLTIAEGLTVAAVLDRLAAAEGMAGEAAEIPAEGSLLPETYHFSHGDRRDALLRRMREAMRAFLAGAWAARAPGLPFDTPEAALVLASIVERETSREDERALVAGVFVNRLRRGMRLQSDPTVAYGIAPEGLGRPLSRADLVRPTPWNTYVHNGLPPTPICNPGKASIRAALNPARTDFLYFVADGTGGHAFARTLAEHNRNVARWRRVRRERGGG